jgi:urea transport system ATP-binding protein
MNAAARPEMLSARCPEWRSSLLGRTPPQPGGLRTGRPSYLEITDLTVSFGSFTAVDGVDLVVNQGDLRFLIGPNGAGKTTLIDAVTGLVPARGSIDHDGHQLVGRRTHRITRLGVGRTFQTASVFEQLTVLQNLDIAAEAGRPPLSLLAARRSVSREVEEALEIINLSALRDVPAGVLAHGQKQWLEIGMLLVQKAQVLLLDEPVAGMSHEEREQTGELLRRIGGDRITIVVEHDMEFLRRYATSVTVMADGRVISEGSVAHVQADPRVQEIYLGTTATAAATAADPREGDS